MACRHPRLPAHRAAGRAPAPPPLPGDDDGRPGTHRTQRLRHVPAASAAHRESRTVGLNRLARRHVLR
ncbi:MULTISPECIES: hypothetical protein [Micromonospora]|uniref:hypothetical protein n=1 Tax=Micromonospora TaxID=1873 RepID=UPI0002E57715|nr:MULTISPECIES: hypothetical protein [Micromonospora]RUL92437.1 hypothetical protein EG812_13390 [Verrucosispora sp. FIM060022]